ncbi:anthranilate phosphoribosyltransferase [Paenibacillus sp. YN15]|nr:anthranilate phosphoribosyltransferase [Paenibacillus sp. YN15]
MKQWIKAVGTTKKEARHLTYDEAVAAAHAIARGESTEAQTAAFLTAVRMKGETDQEVTAFVDVFRKYSLPYASFSDSLNCAGVYGRRQILPVTLPVGLLMASVGFAQVLHGNGAFGGGQGATAGELLQGLGVQTDLAASDWESVFAAAKIGYIRTDRMCPALAGIRRFQEEVGLDTFMGQVERILNPVHSHQMLIGAGQRFSVESLVRILPKVGIKKAIIVQGMEGSEDLSIAKTSTIRTISPDTDETAILEPSTFGFSGHILESMPPSRQLEALTRLIQGDDSPELCNEREHVIYNAGLRLYWNEKVSSYEDGFQLARELYARKEAWKALKKWRDLTAAYTPESSRKKNEAAGA